MDHPAQVSMSLPPSLPRLVLVEHLLPRIRLLFHVATGTLKTVTQIAEGEENADLNSRPMAGS